MKSMFVCAAAVLAALVSCDAMSVPFEFKGPSSWPVPGSADSAGAVEVLARSPGASGSQDRWFAGSVNGGVWATDNMWDPSGNVEWRPVLDGQPVTCYSISAMTVSLSDPNTVFAGCGPSTSSEQGSDWQVYSSGDWAGVMVSHDRGATWAMTTFPSGYHVTSIIAFSPGDLIISARSRFDDKTAGGVWLGRDTGGIDLTWTQTFDLPVYDMEYYDTPSSLVVTVPFSTKTPVLLSVDKGETFEDFSTGLTFPGDQTPYYPQVSFSLPANVLFYGALTVSTTNPDVTNGTLQYRGITDKTWTALTTQLKLDSDAMPKDKVALLADPTDGQFVYIAGNGAYNAYRVAWKTSTWTAMTGSDTPDGISAHGDCRNLYWGHTPTTPGLLMTSDGGVAVRQNPGAPGGRWLSRNRGLAETEFYSVSWDRTEQRMIGAAQDNCVLLAPSHAKPTDQAQCVVGGDGTATAVDNTLVPARLFGTRQFMGVGAELEDDVATDDDDSGANAGFSYFQANGSATLRGDLDLAKAGFRDAHCLPYFNQPWTLSTQNPQQLFFWANCSANVSSVMSPPGFWRYDIPAGPAGYASDLVPSFVSSHSDTVFSMVVGGTTAGKPDPSVMVFMNDTHLSHVSNASALASHPLPVPFAKPVIFVVAPSGAQVLGPLSHDKTVSLAVSPSDSSVVAVTGWTSVTDNNSPEGVWVSTTAGASWVNVTGNLRAATQTIGRVRPSGLLFMHVEKSGNASATALLVGTVSGVYVTVVEPKPSGTWTRLGTQADFPLSMVKELQYEHFTDTLVVASMGRGAFIVNNATQYVAGAMASAGMQLPFDVEEPGRMSFESAAKFFAKEVQV